MEQPLKQPAPSSLFTRTCTGLALVAGISVLLLSGATGLFILVVSLNLLALMEYQKLIAMTGAFPQKFTAPVLGTLLLAMCWLFIRQVVATTIFLWLVPLFFLSIFTELFRAKNQPFANIGLMLLGVAWISVPLGLFLLMAHLPWEEKQYHASIALGYFIILWLGDSGAYLAGKYAGRHKLFPRISPKKTWEGSMGGLLAALLGAFLDHFLFGRFSPGRWVLLAVIINLSGSFGDLTKSMLKRSVGVKDSGTLLPGHGGILDRFDSLIGSVPFTFMYLFFHA